MPAGTFDPNESFKSLAMKELEEETGLSIQKKELTFLGTIYPSPGACDEEISLYLFEKQVSPFL